MMLAFFLLAIALVLAGHAFRLLRVGAVRAHL